MTNAEIAAVFIDIAALLKKKKENILQQVLMIKVFPYYHQK